jgi:hypothetical protein
LRAYFVRASVIEIPKSNKNREHCALRTFSWNIGI